MPSKQIAISTKGKIAYTSDTNNKKEYIHYKHFSGKSPGIIFLSGYMSDMEGNKALALENLCKELGHSYIRFDYRGHGISDGTLVDGSISNWTQDTLNILDNIAKGQQILVGSSMGGWIMMLVSLKRKERISGLIGIASAPDFTEDLLPLQLGKDKIEEIYSQGECKIVRDDGSENIITKMLLEDGKTNLVLRDKITIDCPVELLHGINDEVVPWETSLGILDKISSNNVNITLIKNGDHRLSSPSDIQQLKQTVKKMFKTSVS